MINDEFRVSLARLRSQERRYGARGALAIVLSTALAAFSLLLAVNFHFGSFRFFPLMSFVFFWGAVAGAACVAFVRQLLPLRGEARLASELDDRLGGNLITAALEFSKEGTRLGAYSPYFLAATVRRAKERIGALDPRELFAAAARPAWAGVGVLVALLAAFQVAFLRGDPAAVVASILDPGRSFRFPFQYNLVVTTGDRLVLPGESVTVEAMNFGSMHGDASLRVSTVPGVWNRIGVRGEALNAGALSLSAYRHTFGDVRDDFTYSFSAGGVRTPNYRVSVLHRPVINAMTAVLVFPRYTGAKNDTLQPLAGKIVALAGTRVNLVGETSKRVREGSIRFASGAKVPLRTAPGGFTGSFSVSANDTFTVEVVDTLGFSNDHSVSYPVVALEDRAPTVEILAPEKDAQLPRALSVDLIYRASDDYGLASATLFWMRDGKDERFRAQPLELPAARPITEVEGRTEWSLAEASVFPGDKILYYLEVVDNNTATGPGRARTETRRLLVPSLSEIYARIHEEQAQPRENLEEALDKGHEIHDRLQKLSDELKAEGNLDWSKRRESGEILDKQRELREKMSQVTSEIDKNLETIEKNRSASQEIGEKVEQIRNLVKQIESEDLRKEIESLQKLMSNLPTKELMAAMNQVQIDADKLMQNLDRTIELLKQVIREEKMDELVRRMDDMLKEQTAIRDSTPKAPTDELSKKQDDLGSESKKYEKDLGEFAKEQIDSMIASQLAKAREQMEREKVAEQMKRAASQLSESNREGAQQTENSVLSSMLSLFSSLSSCQMAMGMAMDAETAALLERSARELIEASKLQEEITPKLAEGGVSESPGDLVQDELVVKAAVERISRDIAQASRKVLSLSTRIFVGLGHAQREIEIALGRMEEGRLFNAVDVSTDAYRDLNLAAIELMRSSSSSGGAGGGKSARQMMQQLLQEELSLQQELQRLIQHGNAGQWTMEEQATMARLAAEQRKMEELAKQIADEASGTHELMGKLDDLAGKMEDIAKQLDEGKLDRELMERQEQILTRMLDSQRSMRERDYKRERTSTAAGDVKALAPDTWKEQVNDTEILLKMIQRGMQEKGPAEYEELIREYFRALSEKARETK